MKSKFVVEIDTPDIKQDWHGEDHKNTKEENEELISEIQFTIVQYALRGIEHQINKGIDFDSNEVLWMGLTDEIPIDWEMSDFQSIQECTGKIKISVTDVTA